MADRLCMDCMIVAHLAWREQNPFQRVLSSCVVREFLEPRWHRCSAYKYLTLVIFGGFVYPYYLPQRSFPAKRLLFVGLLHGWGSRGLLARLVGLGRP